MRLHINGADPLYLGAATYAAYANTAWWVLVIPLVIASWFFNPRWDRENGWRFFHDQ